MPTRSNNQKGSGQPACRVNERVNETHGCLGPRRAFSEQGGDNSGTSGEEIIIQERKCLLAPASTGFGEFLLICYLVNEQIAWTLADWVSGAKAAEKRVSGFYDRRQCTKDRTPT